MVVSHADAMATGSSLLCSFCSLISEYVQSIGSQNVDVLMNILNILSALIATVGAVGAVITHADGWTGCLLLFPPLACLLGATALLLLPDLICLLSERQRYRWK